MTRKKAEALRLLPAGECAVVVELGNEIDPELSARVLALDEALLETPFPGYVEAIPSYRSLLLFFEPRQASLESIRDHLRTLGTGRAAKKRPARAVKEVPTVYDGEDLEEVARLVGESPEAVVRLHSEREYLVYMVGFTPGFAYMGSTDEKLHIPRRASPRTRVPAGSVAIAMGQTGIYPSSTPGGWHLLGRAEPRILFDLTRDPPSYFVPGDHVRFVPRASLPPYEGGSPRPIRSSSPPALEVLESGLLTTVQDLGRPGFQRYGVPVAGAVDAPALGAANVLVGNDPGAAGLECTVQGPSLRALRPLVAAVTGGDLGASVLRSDLGCWNVPPWSSFLLRPGNELRFDGRRSGARAYIAIGGGIDVPEVLGSRATYLTAGFGGLEGRPLRTGDRLAVHPPGRLSPPGKRWPYDPMETRGEPPGREGVVLRVVLGPQDDHFTSAAIAALESSAYVVAASSDRMGYRLEGPPLEHRGAKEIVSDGMMLGGIQIPPNGLPIVMLADRATMGGYPKIATVARADLPKLGQRLPGDGIRFRVVSLDEARRAYEEDRRRWEAVR